MTTTTTETDTPVPPGPPAGSIEVRRINGESSISLYVGQRFTPDQLRSFASYLAVAAEEASRRDPELDELIDILEYNGKVDLPVDARHVIARVLLAAGYKRTGSVRGAAEGRQDG